jgi:acyl-CoA synthetase (AMP-forming)/AMP-acid ligase II
VDPETLLARPAGVVGEIWVRGPSVALGYWNRPEESRHTFMAFLADDGRGPYLRTGDLGFLENGELFVTGRLKDLIVCDGRNHYPQDIEQTVEASHDAVLSGCSVAFSVPGRHAEELVIAAEVAPCVKSNDRSVHRRPTEAVRPDEIARAIRRGVAEAHDLSIRRVLLLKPGAILKTSSGKIQRQACRATFLSGGFAGAALSQDATVP